MPVAPRPCLGATYSIGEMGLYLLVHDNNTHAFFKINRIRKGCNDYCLLGDPYVQEFIRLLLIIVSTLLIVRSSDSKTT